MMIIVILESCWNHKKNVLKILKQHSIRLNAPYRIQSYTFTGDLDRRGGWDSKVRNTISELLHDMVPPCASGNKREMDESYSGISYLGV